MRDKLLTLVVVGVIILSAGYLIHRRERQRQDQAQAQAGRRAICEAAGGTYTGPGGTPLGDPDSDCIYPHPQDRR